MQNFDAVNKLIYWILPARYFTEIVPIRQSTSQCLDPVNSKKLYSVPNTFDSHINSIYT